MVSDSHTHAGAHADAYTHARTCTHAHTHAHSRRLHILTHTHTHTPLSVFVLYVLGIQSRAGETLKPEKEKKLKQLLHKLSTNPRRGCLLTDREHSVPVLPVTRF